MSKYIHLNLIKAEELVTSSPVRTHAIAPILIAMLTVGIIVWWLFLYSNYSSLQHINDRHIEITAQIEPSYKQVLDLIAKEKELTALNAQIAAFDHSRLTYAAVLSQLPEQVDPNIQIVMLEVTAPSPPLFKKDADDSAPTNTFSTTELIITGRAVSTTVDAVDELLKTFRTGISTNLIQSASIPKGSFRQESKPKENDREFVLFEIRCPCWPRRFQ